MSAKMHLRFGSGNVVRWSGGLWIVEETQEEGERDGRRRPPGVRLISFSSSRVTAFPTDEWPPDRVIRDEDDEDKILETIKGNRIDTIELLADNVEDFIKRRLFELFGNFK